MASTISFVFKRKLLNWLIEITYVLMETNWKTSIKYWVLSNVYEVIILIKTFPYVVYFFINV